MQVNDYQLQELHFAYCYHAYLHWRTHRRKPYPELATLNRSTLHDLVEPLSIHVLECDSRATESRVLVSLRPDETMSGCASKLKGRVSKWLRQRLGQEQPATLLARGYFACTSGGSTSQKVEAYLQGQAEHHGYSQRSLPPVFMDTYQPNQETQPWWHAEHACTHLQFHLVLATSRRRGVFGPNEGAAVARRWLDRQREHRFALCKLSFVPDHVHVALSLHPGGAPAPLVVMLMNEAQRLLAERFPVDLLRARLPRVWQPSAYIGAMASWQRPRCRITFGAGKRRSNPPMDPWLKAGAFWGEGGAGGCSKQPNDPRLKAGGFLGGRRCEGVATNPTIPGSRPGASGVGGEQQATERSPPRGWGRGRGTGLLPSTWPGEPRPGVVLPVCHWLVSRVVMPGARKPCQSQGMSPWPPICRSLASN
jgi:REP element-mobilizing transposase RayT